jgi:NADPH:quinone reductase-like Zn-dependent oxidoreductase
MKAICLQRRGGPEALVSIDVPRPVPGPGEVLIHVHATTITPTEFTWSATWTTPQGADRQFPIILGHEFSGVVTALGPDVHSAVDMAEGVSVFGLNDWSWQGAEAEYSLARPDELGPKPHSLDHAHAAEVPISGLTAWQALVDHAQLAPGQRVLIQGATGGVGSFAVQLAHYIGAQVLATTSPANVDYARELGADVVLDYTKTRFEEVLHDVDVVLDTVGGETLDRSWSVLRPGGTLVTTLSPPSRAQADPQGVRGIYFQVQANRAELLELARLIDAGLVRPVVAAIDPLEAAPMAYLLARDSHPRGKYVLRVADE